MHAASVRILITPTLQHDRNLQQDVLRCTDFDHLYKHGYVFQMAGDI